MEQRLRKLIPDRSRWLVLTLVVFTAGAAWVWSSAVPDSATTGGRIPSPREGFLAPDFTLDLLTGGEMTVDGRGDDAVGAKGQGGDHQSLGFLVPSMQS